MINVLNLLWAMIILMLVVCAVSIILVIAGKLKHLTTWAPIISIALVLIAFAILIMTFKNGKEEELQTGNRELTEEVTMNVTYVDSDSIEYLLHKGYYTITDNGKSIDLPIDRTVFVSATENLRLETYRVSKVYGIFTYTEYNYRLYVPFTAD